MKGRGRTGAAIFFLCWIFLPLASAKLVNDKLKVGYYEGVCTPAEDIVAEVVAQAFYKDPGTAAGLLFLTFHDCFVNGCDASILLDAMPSGEQVEKNSPINGKFLRGLEVLDEAKARLEAQCPETVSCADTLAFAARDGLILSGLPYYHVESGRRDGLVSLKTDVAPNLPVPTWPIKNITELYANKGLTQEDMVVLMGAHTIGVAHCNTFMYRVQGYNNTVQTDPKLDASDFAIIKSACLKPGPVGNTDAVPLPFEPYTPTVIDNVYYQHMMRGKGLLESDRALKEDPETLPILQQMASDQLLWFDKFRKAIVKLGTMDAKTGTEGEIRRNCRFVNSDSRSSQTGPIKIPEPISTPSGKNPYDPSKFHKQSNL